MLPPDPPSVDGAPAAPPAEPAPPAPRRRARDAAVALGLAAALTAIYSANGGVLPTKDAAPSLYAAANLLEEGRLSFTPTRDPWMYDWDVVEGGQVVASLRINDLDADLDGRTPRQLRAEGILVPSRGYWLAPSRQRDGVGGEPLDVPTFGVGAALAAAPVLAAVRAVAGDLRAAPGALWYGGKLAASLMVALSAALVYLAGRRWLRPGPALLVAVAYGLGTSVWSVSSQALWQHAPGELFLALGGCALVRARETRWGSAVAGLAFALATACRPTSALFATAALGWLALVDRRRALQLALAAAPVALAVAGYNHWHFGSPLRFGQTVVGPALAEAMTGRADQWQTPLWVGLPGVLVSPSRGLLVFSPFLLAALPGAARAFRRPDLAPLRPLALAAAALAVVAAKHYDWWGGWTYGYRHLVDLAPALALLLVPAVERPGRSRLAGGALAVALAWSIALQALGAFAFDMDGWNARTGYLVRLPSGETVAATADEVEQVLRERGGRLAGSVAMNVGDPAYRRRLWSVRDGQIAYSLGHLREVREKRRADTRGWIEWWRAVPR